MDTNIVQTVARHVEKAAGEEGFRYICAIVANCKMLALQLEAEEESPTVHMEDLIMAAYFHDISTTEHGFHDHARKSAEMALDFLRPLQVPHEQLARIEQILLAHTTVLSTEQRKSTLIEAQILFDADKLGRLSGLAVVTSLIEFGARYPNREVTEEALAAILRHIEERFIELYQSLNTSPAREMSREKFHGTLAFLDGVIEHLSDATPV